MATSSLTIAGKKPGENGDPWPVLASAVNNPKELPSDLRSQVKGFTDTWKYLAGDRGKKRLELGKLLARFDINLTQAARWWDPAARNEAGIRLGGEEVADAAILKNPYIFLNPTGNGRSRLPFARSTRGVP